MVKDMRTAAFGIEETHRLMTGWRVAAIAASPQPPTNLQPRYDVEAIALRQWPFRRLLLRRRKSAGAHALNGETEDHARAYSWKRCPHINRQRSGQEKVKRDFKVEASSETRKELENSRQVADCSCRVLTRRTSCTSDRHITRRRPAWQY